MSGPAPQPANDEAIFPIAGAVTCVALFAAMMWYMDVDEPAPRAPAAPHGHEAPAHGGDHAAPAHGEHAAPAHDEHAAPAHGAETHEGAPPAKHEEAHPAHGEGPHAPAASHEAPAPSHEAPAPAHEAPSHEPPAHEAPAPSHEAPPTHEPPPPPPREGAAPSGAPHEEKPHASEPIGAREEPFSAERPVALPEEDDEDEGREDKLVDRRPQEKAEQDDDRKDDDEGEKREAEPARPLAAGPLLGYGGADAVYVWAQPSDRKSKIEVAISPEGADVKAAPRVVAMPAVPEGAFETAVRIDGLSPATRYSYEVRAGGAASEATRGSFRTGPAPGQPVKGRIAVVSCMHPKRWASQKTWLALAADRPDLLLSIGDNIYANSTVPEVIREWYRLQRNVPEYAPLIRAVPQLSVWDDHDFGANDSDGTLPGKENTLATWKALWPNPAYGLPDAPGCFYSSSFGDVDIFMLDDRWYRSPNAAPDDEKKEFLGEKQFAWLEKGVKASKATFKLVVSGSTIFAGMKDCWRLYSKDRKRLLSLTQATPGIVYVTGDIHTSLVARIGQLPELGYPYYEVVSSGVAVNPSLFFYVTIDVDTQSEDRTLKVRVHQLDRDGKEQKLDERVIHRSELAPGF